MVKVTCWALVPPDQIGKEALAYSKFLGRKSYTINSGNLLNMHVGCILCTIKFFGKQKCMVEILTVLVKRHNLLM